MKRLVETILLLAMLLSCLAGCQRQVTADLPADLQKAIAAFYDAIETGDTQARVDLLADEVILMPNHWTMYRGFDEVAGLLEAGSDAVFKIRDRVIVAGAAGPELAYTVNSYAYTYHLVGDPPQWHQTKNLHLWRRDAEGRWRLQVDIWNSDVPVSEFDTE